MSNGNGYRRHSYTSNTAKIQHFVWFVMYCSITGCSAECCWHCNDETVQSTIEHAWSRDHAKSSVTTVLPPLGQRCGTVCLNSFGNRTSPSDNSNDHWKRLCLVSWAAAPCVWTLRAQLKIFLLTYYKSNEMLNFCCFPCNYVAYNCFYKLCFWHLQPILCLQLLTDTATTTIWPLFTNDKHHTSLNTKIVREE